MEQRLKEYPNTLLVATESFYFFVSHRGQTKKEMCLDSTVSERIKQGLYVLCNKATRADRHWRLVYIGILFVNNI